MTPNRIAQIDDIDLDINIPDLYLTSVTTWERELIIGGYAEEGCWDSGNGLETMHSIELTMGVSVRATLPRHFDHLVERLESWRDDHVPIRLIGAPNRLSALIENPAVWIPIPRQTMPGMVS